MNEAGGIGLGMQLFGKGEARSSGNQCQNVMTAQLMKTRMSKCVCVWCLWTCSFTMRSKKEAKEWRRVQKKSLCFFTASNTAGVTASEKHFPFFFPYLIFPLPLLPLFYFIIPFLILALPLNCLPRLLSHPPSSYVCNCDDSSSVW